MLRALKWLSSEEVIYHCEQDGSRDLLQARGGFSFITMQINERKAVGQSCLQLVST